MKIGFLTSCLRNVDLPELIRWAGGNGFGAVEIRVVPQEKSGSAYMGGALNPAGVTRESAQELEKVAEESSVSISCLTYCVNQLDPDVEKREAQRGHLLRVIDAAALMDVDVVSCFVGRNPEKDTEGNLVEFGEVFGKIMNAAADKGVRIAVENCPMVGWQVEGLAGNIAYSPPIWRKMFEIFPEMGLNYDPSHLVWMGIDHVKAVAEFADRIYHVHAKDTEIMEGVLADRGILAPSRPHWRRYRAPGYGVIDWAKFISVLVENGYDNVLSIEHEDPVFGGDEAMIRRGLILGRKHLAQFVE